MGFPLEAGFSIILRPGSPACNPEIDEEFPFVSTSQITPNWFHASFHPAPAPAKSLVLTKFVQPPGVALGFCRIHRGDLATKGIARRGGLVRRLDTADTAPALARPGFNLAHLLDGMMCTAVIAEFGLIRHGQIAGRDSSIARPVVAHLPENTNNREQGKRASSL
jgi:hypothetical protein